MPNYNIFRVDPTKRDDMMQKFQEVGLKETFNEDIDGYRHIFYFSDHPIDAEIEWINLYSSFINLESPPTNKSYFAVMIITVPNGNEYAISMGKAHFYIKSFCYYDFGLQLAERIFNKSKLKHSKFYSSRKSKTITSYVRSNELSYDSGESIGLLKGSTIDDSIWGKSVTFGQSIKLSIPHMPDEIYLILDEIEREMKNPAILHLPRAKIVTDQKEIRRLDELLLNKLRSNRLEVEMDEFTVNSVFFNFTDEYDGFAIQIKTKIGDSPYSKKTTKMDTISSDMVGQFLQDISTDGVNEVDNFDKVKVAFWKDGKRRYSQPVKEIIDFVTDDWYCLMGGKWMQFSQDYIRYLKGQIDSVQLNRDNTIILKKYTKKQCDTLGMQNETEQTIIEQMEAKGFEVLHKGTSKEEGIEGFNVEVADLRHNDCLYFIKMGTPQKLNYVINQSLNTVRLIQNKRIDKDPSVQGVNSICLWIIFDDRKTDISALSQVNSIIFLMAMNDWIQAVRDAGFTPVVNIGYRRYVNCD